MVEGKKLPCYTPELTVEEILKCYQLEVARHEFKRSKKVHSFKRDPESKEYEVGFIGIVGEYSFDRFLAQQGVRLIQGMKWDVSAHGDDGHDIIAATRNEARRPLKIGVQTPMGRGRNFLLKNADANEFKADIMVLMWPVVPLVRGHLDPRKDPSPFRRFEPVGCMTRTKFFNLQEKYEPRNFGYGFRAWAPYKEFDPIQKLLRVLTS